MYSGSFGKVYKWFLKCKLMAKTLLDCIEVGNKTFPKLATRKKLEEIGARHLISDKFKVAGTERNIEYMIIEGGNYGIVWRKMENSENYRLHLLAPELVKFTKP